MTQAGQNERPSFKGINERPATGDDLEFLIRVYASTRQEELALWGWNPDQVAKFCQMQFEVRQRGFAAAYPSAETCVVSVEGIPAGSMIIYRGGDEIRLLDISLLPEFRGRGAGGELVRRLISESLRSRRALRLSVFRGNRAAHLYERLGFIVTGGDEMYCEMELALAQTSDLSKADKASLEGLSNAGKVE